MFKTFKPQVQWCSVDLLSICDSGKGGKLQSCLSGCTLMVIVETFQHFCEKHKQENAKIVDPMPFSRSEGFNDAFIVPIVAGGVPRDGRKPGQSIGGRILL